MSLSLAAAADAAAAAISAAGSTAGTASSTGTANLGNVALQKLGSNFNDFLNLLLTQLKNQDPSQPMDTNAFTTELVQFTGVQQQVATNTSLGTLIQLQQGSQAVQAAQLVGHQATVTASQITLQKGTGEVQFTGVAGQDVAIAVVGADGRVIRDASLTAQGGTNTWTWNGQDNNGSSVPDGAYRVAVETAASGGTASAIPYTVVGTATGVSTNGTATQVQLGALSVNLSAVQSISGS